MKRKKKSISDKTDMNRKERAKRGLHEEIMERSLPEYLKDDIMALTEGYRTNSSLLDCLYCEVQGSINSALYSDEITEEQAAFFSMR